MVWEGPLKEMDSMTSGYKLVQEFISSVNDGQLDTQPFGQSFLDNLGFVLSQNTVVDQDGVESVTDGFGSDSLDFSVDEVLHGPVLGGLTDINSKVLQQDLTLFGVSHFWVELDTVDLLLLVGDTTVWRVFRSGNDLETIWQAVQLVTVGHPDLGVVNVLEQRRRVVDDA
ncbi:hypothetical protein WICPIJ_007737 [Wickerhamomyces pijperi]|uniref:Uncharacterized protein n=1 Tax=Wickerhamomyces pijperi TaxID=599730 RepID=A0A9P8TIZ2_WICPI|nr:hypothetical protein WICPIJ_007737 [Wickerhamomyces pijperi]